MEKTKYIVRVAMCVAILIAGQMALSGISGVEIVTVVSTIYNTNSKYNSACSLQLYLVVS